MSIFRKFKLNKIKISLINCILICYILSFIVFVTASELIFMKYISAINNQNEKNIYDLNIEKFIEYFSLKHNNKENIFDNIFFIYDRREKSYIKVIDLINNKVIFMSPGMNEFINKLEDDIDEDEYNNPLTPNNEFLIRKRNSIYFYYVKKEVKSKNNILKFEFLLEKTKKISEQLENRKKIFYSSILILLILLVFSLIVLKAILSPLNNIVNNIRKINFSNLNNKVQSGWLPKELLIIKNSFNDLLMRLEDSFQRVSQFSDDIAHEIRTPVNTLKVEIEVALQKDKSKEDYKNILISNLEECESLVKIIENLTFLSRAEKKDIKINPELINVNKEFLRIKDLYSPLLEEKCINLTIKCNLNIELNVDKILFLRIFRNLVSNAITYNKINGEILIKAESNKDFLNIEVSDTGVGISENNLSYIFDRFYKVETVRNSSNNNLGLGLSMVKSMVALHNGFIEIKSREGIGTSVFIRFPTNL